MKRASILTIGNEVLSGQTLNSNAAYLGRKLVSTGIGVVSSYTVGDDIDSIVTMLELASHDGDVILITGGLGSTDDDLTRQALSRMLGKKLELQQELLGQIEEFFNRRGSVMPQRNKLQAYIPAGSKAMVNRLGTAPGILAQAGGKLYVAMPGVPSEMEQMFEQSVWPVLKELAGGHVICVRKLRCFGACESAIAEMLGELMGRARNPLINCTASGGIITLHIIASSPDEQAAQRMVQADEKHLRAILGRLVFGIDDETLADVIGQMLTEQKKTIAVAESCTGGLLAKMLTDIPGASKYFMQSWVTYSNTAKVDELGISPELIEKNGQVSQQVSEAMAKAARSKAGTDIGIGITGIAGPTGASEQKPLGLVYISLCYGQNSRTERFVFSGKRDSVRLSSAQTALNMVRLALDN
ncbi:MAG: competence/damage-inducible protein A [Planctomycetota bacterium]|jgi:nicotinamide-nucleotide amidase